MKQTKSKSIKIPLPHYRDIMQVAKRDRRSLTQTLTLIVEYFMAREKEAKP